MAISALFDTPYFTGVGSTTDVPSLFPVALNGRPYILDLNQTRLTYQFKRESIPVLRSQANTSNLPDESSMNPEDLWRRAQDSWHKGAGQRFLDKQDSDPARFRKSVGVNVWEKWQLSLLPDVNQQDTYAATSAASLVSTSTRLYLGHGGLITYYTTVGGAGTDVGTSPGTNVLSLASDGYSVYAAYGTNGIYLTNRTIGTKASWITGSVNLVRYVQGRLMAAYNNLLYNVITGTGTAGPTALPVPLYTHPNTDWQWVDMAEGPGQIYMAGFSGDKSYIYRTAIKADGTALDIPVKAGELPDGEIIRCIQGYLGYLVIGSDYGVRFCTVDGQGNLTIGPLLNTGQISVLCLEPQDRFVWFGWSRTAGATAFGGLGRMDLSVFTAPLAPAFATDLGGEATTALTTLAVATFLGKRVYAVASAVPTLFLYNESATVYVTTAYIDSGVFTFGLPDSKVAMWADLRLEPLPSGATVEVQISVDGGAFTSLGTFSTAAGVGYTFPIGQKLGRNFELRVKLAGSGSVFPTISRFTLRAYAAPNRAEQWSLPILLHETVLANGGVPHTLSVLDELNRIRSMISDKQLVTYQEGNETHLVFVEDYTWVPRQPTADATFWQGLCSVTIKETST